jgi:hypothetical protein
VICSGENALNQLHCLFTSERLYIDSGMVVARMDSASPSACRRLDPVNPW